MKAEALTSKQVTRFVESIFEDDLHAKRVASVASATLGAVEAASLSIHAIGHGLAEADDLNAKHAVKQVDRLLSNSGVVVCVVPQRRPSPVARAVHDVFDWTR
jgi:hypothetical protein